MTQPELFAKLCQIARYYGVSEFQVGELKAKLDFEPKIPIPNEAPAPVNVEGMPTDDQMMLWSTDFMPEHKGRETKLNSYSVDEDAL